MNSEIVMYQTEDGLTKIETTFDNDKVWLSIDQMAELFQRDKSTISRHIKNIFNEGEKSDIFYAVSELPSKYRIAIHLYYYEDLSVKEISSILNLKENVQCS